MSSVPIRLAARVLLVDERQRLLLLRSVDPADGSVFWFPPGGGIEPGEDATAAAVREVWEETGLQNCPLEGEVWRRRHLFTWGTRTYDQHEHWFLARVSHFEPAPGALTVAGRRKSRQPRRRQRPGRRRRKNRTCLHPRSAASKGLRRRRHSCRDQRCHRGRCRACRPLHRPRQPNVELHLPSHRLPPRPRRRGTCLPMSQR